MGNFVALQTGLSALRAAQAGIDVTSHNVANANTPGYTRQRTVQAARSPYDSSVGPMGTGVNVERVQRMRDTFLDTRVRTTTADAAFDGVRADLLGRAEAVTGEPDAGIAVELDHLWAAFEDLANDPAEPATRTQVLDALETVTARINNVAGAWDDLAADTAGRRDALLDEINDLVDQVADIDRQVMNLGEDAEVPADLLDERDLALDRIAEATGAKVARQPEGHVVISLGDGTTVLDIGPPSGEKYAFGADANGTITLDGSEAAVSGELGGIEQFLQRDLQAHKDALDDFAVALAEKLNDQHTSGRDLDGNVGGPLLGFAAAPPAGAGNLSVANLSGRQVAAGKQAAPYDGDNAQDLADIRNDEEVTGAYRDVVVGLGAQVAAGRRSADAKAELGYAAERARTSAHGVSIDEEMVSLIHYQRALEAASRVMTSVDEALDVLVNRTGLVGR